MGAHRSSFEDKVKWFVGHPEVTKGWPIEPYTDKAIARMLRDDGLVSDGAHDYDLADFSKAISEARSRLRHARRYIKTIASIYRSEGR